MPTWEVKHLQHAWTTDAQKAIANNLIEAYLNDGWEHLSSFCNGNGTLLFTLLRRPRPAPAKPKEAK